MDGGVEKKTRRIWAKKTEWLLIRLWRSKLPQLRAARKNSHIYEAIASDLRRLDSECESINGPDVQIKVNNLTKKFRVEQRKQMTGQSGGSPSTWVFYNDVQNIIKDLKQKKKKGGNDEVARTSNVRKTAPTADINEIHLKMCSTLERIEKRIEGIAQEFRDKEKRSLQIIEANSQHLMKYVNNFEEIKNGILPFFQRHNQA